ncbi:EthD family reductase [Xylanimonas cellulosilytica]|nr:EthD family reductase [Xylanimonas cellulosilytica]
MTTEEFQDYWISVHAQEFAAKIPQIKKYKVNRILPVGPAPVFHGMAEIWLENEAEQLASLQSPEFVDGARADEPRWAAFWQSLGLDTTTVPIVAAGHGTPHKLVVLVKRKGGIPLSVFRRYALDTIGARVREVEGLRDACLCVVGDGAYGVGEARFDAAFQLWFDDVEAVSQARRSAAYDAVARELNDSCDSVYEFVCEENAII